MIELHNSLWLEKSRSPVVQSFVLTALCEESCTHKLFGRLHKEVSEIEKEKANLERLLEEEKKKVVVPVLFLLAQNWMFICPFDQVGHSSRLILHSGIKLDDAWSVTVVLLHTSTSIRERIPRNRPQVVNAKLSSSDCGGAQIACTFALWQSVMVVGGNHSVPDNSGRVHLLDKSP